MVTNLVLRGIVQFADDIELFQSAAKECAESIEILTAEDGLELMELLKKEPMPDVVVLDFKYAANEWI